MKNLTFYSDWTVIGLSLDCHWTVIGLSLDCHWTVIGLSLDCHWTVIGLSLDCHWTVIGLSLDCQVKCDRSIEFRATKREKNGGDDELLPKKADVEANEIEERPE